MITYREIGEGPESAAIACSTSCKPILTFTGSGSSTCYAQLDQLECELHGDNLYNHNLTCDLTHGTPKRDDMSGMPIHGLHDHETLGHAHEDWSIIQSRITEEASSSFRKNQLQ